MWKRLRSWLDSSPKRAPSLLTGDVLSLNPEDRLGPYRIVRNLGSGSMGTVYEALHGTIGRRVALKILHPYLSHDDEMVARLLQEAQASNLVHHPGVVQINDHHQLRDGTTYLVMELLNGETLRTRLRREPPLTATEILSIGGQLAVALAAAHAQGVIHRDLKPANVMLDPDGQRVKILDFGIARAASLTSQLTGDGRRLGTPAYMAPEQCAGERARAAADVYALGALLYELCANRPPFVAEDEGALYGMHRYEEPRPIGELVPHVSEALARLIHDMLAKNPDSRPSMLEVARELQAQGAPIDIPESIMAASDSVRPKTSQGSGPPILRSSSSQRLVRAGAPRTRWLLWLVGVMVAGVCGTVLWSGWKDYTIPHHIRYRTVTWVVQEMQRSRLPSAAPLGRPLDSGYLCTWFQRFQGGKVFYTTGGIAGLPTGPYGRTFFVLSMEPTERGNRWSMLQHTNYHSIREPTLFLQAVAEGRASAPDIGLPKPFAPLPDIGRYFRVQSDVEHPAVAGSVSRLYALKALDTVLGKPLEEECATTMLITTYENAIVFGGAPNDSCFETQGIYLLHTESRQPSAAQGRWDREDRQPLLGSTFHRNCLPPSIDVSLGRRPR